MRLAATDTVIAVVPESHHGPGWSNQILIVVVRDADGKLRTESVQWQEFTRDQHALFFVGLEAQRALMATIEKDGAG